MKALLIVIGVAVLLALGFFALNSYIYEEKQGESPMLRYENAEHGIAFQYPEGYVLTERSVDGRVSVALVREEDATPPEGGEGPTAITIDMSRGTLDDAIAVSGIPDGEKRSTKVEGRDAVVWRWSGLYEGETTAFTAGASAVLASVTFFAPTDAIVADYRAVMDSLTVSAAAMPERAQLSGTIVCLPHKGDGPHTMECAFGLKTDDGAHYGLSLALMSQSAAQLDTGDYITAWGVITPVPEGDRLAIYDIEGLFSVTDSLSVQPEGAKD